MTGSAYRAGVGVAILASFLTVWTTIVRDDGTGAAPKALLFHTFFTALWLVSAVFFRVAAKEEHGAATMAH